MWDCAVSFTWLKSFVEKYKTKLKNQSTQQVVTKIVIPETAERKVRYVDLLPSNCVSTPTFFASHVWSEPFLNLIDSLQYYVEGMKEDEVFIWVDIFAVNQHGTEDQSNDLKGKHQALPVNRLQDFMLLFNNLRKLLFVWIETENYSQGKNSNYSTVSPCIIESGAYLRFGTHSYWT